MSSFFLSSLYDFLPWVRAQDGFSFFAHSTYFKNQVLVVSVGTMDIANFAPPFMFVKY